MILKASQRGGARQLGAHLMRTDDNEHVEVHQVRGFVSSDVSGAMKEAYAVSKGTNCRQFLFSVSLNPPEGERAPVETFESATDRIETANGLEGQPRIVVFHEKEGRRHCHAVWSRIDPETMTARPLPFYKNKLREVSRELYLEQGWKMPRGLMDSREADPRNFSLQEWQEAKRAALPARDLKQGIQEAWAVSDTRESFASALEEQGLRLARGDRRGFVAVTTRGDVISLSRFAGKKPKELEARLGQPGELPALDETKARIARDMTPVISAYLNKARERSASERTPLEENRRALAGSHRGERARLDLAQKDRFERESAERAQRFRKGLAGVLDRMTGREAALRKKNGLEAFEALQRDREQRQRLIFAQLAERSALQTKIMELRIRHSKELADLHRDLARLRRGDLSVMPEHARSDGIKKRREPKREEPQKNARPQAPPMLERAKRDTALESKLEALRSVSPEKRTTRSFEEASRRRSPHERLQRLRDQPDAVPRRSSGPELNR